MQIQSMLRRLVDGGEVSEDEALATMAAIMDGEATPAQTGALLTALRIRGEAPAVIAGFARAMRARSVKVSTRRQPLVDMCGTGGDACDTFNISTTAMFVAAAAGVAIAKHGNRAVSSRCGSADVLAALGVALDLSPEQIGACIDEVGVGFMFAQHHHPAMKSVAGPRRELGFRTIFNVLGPLTNPAGATRQLVGVYSPELCPVLAEVLGMLDCERALVVHGMNGMDEISTAGPTRISQLQHGRVSTETRIPAEFHVHPCSVEELAGADSPDGNAEIIRRVLAGEKGPRRDVVCVNAAAGLILGGMAEGWADGMGLAQRMIDSGRARAVLANLVEFTQNCSSK